MKRSVRMIPLEGTSRRPMYGARQGARVHISHRVEVTLRLRSRGDEVAAAADECGAHRPARKHHLTPQQFEDRFGAHDRDVEKVTSFAAGHGMFIEHVDLRRRSVMLAGPNDAVSRAFRVERRHFHHRRGSYHGHVGPVHIPVELAGVVEGVLGLDARPQAKRQMVRQRVQLGYTPVELARLYNFPRASGRGQCIALIELGGGYRRSDLTSYFRSLGLRVPEIFDVSVHGARNAPHSRALFSSEEVTADIEVAGAAAPGARLVVYFAPNTERGFFDAVTTAIHDRRHQPSVISISWGQAETEWTPRTLRLFNEALAEAALVGVTVCCSAGDRGSSDGLPGGAPHVIFPASSPFVLACGGTRVDVENLRLARETVWNSRGATGGGPSRVFAVPRWQGKVKVPSLPGKKRRRGRGIPDVAANADPMTGYKVRFRGKDSITGGTSLAAPMWAALVARINQKLRRPVGYLNPYLYRTYQRLLRAHALRPITSGNNGAYHAHPGWNACCGLGSPHGENLLRALKR